jgi:hypothetical protein
MCKGFGLNNQISQEKKFAHFFKTHSEEGTQGLVASSEHYKTKDTE